MSVETLLRDAANELDLNKPDYERVQTILRSALTEMRKEHWTAPPDAIQPPTLLQTRRYSMVLLDNGPAGEGFTDFPQVPPYGQLETGR
jgi:hypothetical protein